jgi:phosphoribosylglycinamide formyltransferase-1
MSATPAKVAVLASGRGSNLTALLDARARGELPVEFVLVGSDRADARALRLAETANIPTLALDPRGYPDRRSFDLDLFDRVAASGAELLVLAGFMRILSTGFVHAFRGKILNIHPSLLPKYTGLNTHERALQAGDKVHGVSVHFVTEELDGGPVIAQAEVTVTPEDTPKTLAEKVQKKEHLLYPIVVRWFCEGRIQLGTDYALFDGELLTQPTRLPDN